MKYEMPNTDDRPIWDVWLSSLWMPAVTAADELDLFDTISQNPGTVKDLIRHTGFSARGMEALFRLLAALGFLAVRLSEGEVADRVDTCAVDMFRQEWPPGYDAVFFSNIFHDWSFETCAELARRAFANLPAGGRIFLHEMLVNGSGDGPLTAAAFSVLMLLGTEGRQFTLNELAELLEKTGFRDVSATATYGYYSLVIGRK
ncbi:MAG: hypothetical protein HYY48_03400 [Gammaproteobacteria bacterium]|nr:hypothetical protein [Gammaproteobacteria bacterium]